MTATGKLLRELGAEITLVFSKKLPGGWEADVNTLLLMLNKAKTFEDNPATVTLAALLPDNIGNYALAFITKITNEGIVTLEIAQGAEAATAGITDPGAKANAIIAYVISEMKKKSPDFQEKHWVDIAIKFLVGLLNINTVEARAIIALQESKQSA